MTSNVVFRILLKIAENVTLLEAITMMTFQVNRFSSHSVTRGLNSEENGGNSVQRICNGIYETAQPRGFFLGQKFPSETMKLKPPSKIVVKARSVLLVRL